MYSFTCFMHETKQNKITSPVSITGSPPCYLLQRTSTSFIFRTSRSFVSRYIDPSPCSYMPVERYNPGAMEPVARPSTHLFALYLFAILSRIIWCFNFRKRKSKTDPTVIWHFRGRVLFLIYFNFYGRFRL